MIIGNKAFETSGHTYIMGILNVTPDSFSDGGLYTDVESALRQTERMIAEGADMIDVGGESTRPGYTKISDDEEIQRIAPVIERIKREFDTVVSVDTYKAGVAQAAIDAGADVINDIWGLRYDEGQMADVIAKNSIPCILMHNRIEPVAAGENFAAAMKSDMEKVLTIASTHGISKDKIIVDPGVGFGKTYEHNLMVLAADNFYMPEGYPVLLATSRKSVIGLTLDLPKDQRVEGTLVTSVLAVQQGAMFIRVHDVKENYNAVRMMRRIKEMQGTLRCI